MIRVSDIVPPKNDVSRILCLAVLLQSQASIYARYQTKYLNKAKVYHLSGGDNQNSNKDVQKIARKMFEK